MILIWIPVCARSDNVFLSFIPTVRSLLEFPPTTLCVAMRAGHQFMSFKLVEYTTDFDSLNLRSFNEGGHKSPKEQFHSTESFIACQ